MVRFTFGATVADVCKEGRRFKHVNYVGPLNTRRRNDWSWRRAEDSKRQLWLVRAFVWSCVTSANAGREKGKLSPKSAALAALVGRVADSVAAGRADALLSATALAAVRTETRRGASLCIDANARVVVSRLVRCRRFECPQRPHSHICRCRSVFRCDTDAPLLVTPGCKRRACRTPTGAARSGRPEHSMCGHWRNRRVSCHSTIIAQVPAVFCRLWVWWRCCSGWSRADAFLFFTRCDVHHSAAPLTTRICRCTY